MPPASVPHWELILPDQLVGVEVEVDRETVLSTTMPDNYGPEWVRKHDGSLRDGYEFILAAPLKGKSLVDSVYKLYEEPTQVHRTYTGSTHIHLNMLDDTSFDALRVLTLISYAFESVLYHAGDATRQWCGYASRLTSAPAQILETVLNESNAHNFSNAINNTGRYYGLNLAALMKYGTVEFRYFPTATTAEELLRWVNLVQTFKKAAIDVGTVENFLDTLSNKEGYNTFVSTYFSEYADLVAEVCPYAKIRALVSKAMVIATASSVVPNYKNLNVVNKFLPLKKKLNKAKKQFLRGSKNVYIISSRDDYNAGRAAMRGHEVHGTSALIVLVYETGQLYFAACEHGEDASNYENWTWQWINDAWPYHPAQCAQFAAAKEVILAEGARLYPLRVSTQVEAFATLERRMSDMPPRVQPPVYDDPDDYEDHDEEEEF